MAQPATAMPPSPEGGETAPAPEPSEGWFREPITGTPVFRGADGLVRLKDAGGTIFKVAPDKVHAALTAKVAPLSMAKPEDIEQYRANKVYNKASAGDVAKFAGREFLKGAADSVTAPVRLAAALGSNLNGEPSSLEDTLSGERLVQKLDEYTGGDSVADAERARQLAKAAPWIKGAANIGGFLAGGAAVTGGLGAAAEGLGLGAEAGEAGAELGAEAGAHAAEHGSHLLHAAKEIGQEAYEGAKVSLASGTDEAWVKNEKQTAESQLASIGIGALLGGGFAAAGELLPAAARLGKARAAQVFGPAKTVEGALERSGNEAAVSELAEDVLGQKPAAGFGKSFREAVDYIREKVEKGQAVATGADEKAIHDFGAFATNPEAIKGQELYLRRPQIIEAATRDLTDAVNDLHNEARPIYDEMIDAELKKKAIAPKLTGDKDVMRAAIENKRQELIGGLEKLDEINIRGRSVLGEGKQIADLRAAYEDTLDRLGEDGNVEDSVIALDKFKRRMQRVKVNAETTSRRVASGVEIEQARARAQLANDISENMRKFLEDDQVFGEFGQAQARVNKGWSRMLDTDAYVNGKTTEKIGSDFGIPKYTASEQKIGSYLDGIGTAKSRTVDNLFRDNIVAHKELAQAIVDSYDLAGHAPGLQKVIEATDRIQKIMSRVDETVARSNQIQAIMDAEAASGVGHGAALAGYGLGSAVGGPVGGAIGSAAATALTKPGSMIRQAIALRSVMSRVKGSIAESIGMAIRGGEEGIAATRSAIGEHGLAGVAENIGEAEGGAPVRRFAKQFVGEHVKEHAKGAIMARLEKAGGEEAGAHAAEREAAATGGEHEEHGRKASAAAKTAVYAAHDKDTKDKRYEQIAHKLVSFAADPVVASESVANATHGILHQGTADQLLMASTNALSFLQSKLPAPIYANTPLSPKQLQIVSDADKSKFLLYYDAVNKPLNVFKSLATGMVTPEQIEAIKACYPSLYEEAQAQVAKAVQSRKTPLPYQTRLNLSGLFDARALIEPTYDPGFMSRISAASQASGQQNPPHPQTRGGKVPNIAGASKSPLDKLNM